MKEERKPANREIGAPGNANLPIGRRKNTAANQGMGVAGAANQEIGVPSTPSWHSRGYLPHVESAQLIQHVTFHLADSLPKEVVERLDAELKSLPVEKQDVERRKRVEAWLDAGHGSCVLREPGMATMVQNCFLFFDGQRYRLLAWVVMPNHVHVLFQPMEGWTVAKIVASWKKFTARKICDHRRSGSANGNANLLIGRADEGNEEAIQENGVPGNEEAIRENGVPGVPGVPVPPVWHREYWDRYMRDENHLAQAVDYIHKNPVKARLVNSSEEWFWSSAFLQKANEENDGAGGANREIGGPGL